MTDTLKTIIGIAIPLFGTSFGASAVFFLKRKPGKTFGNALLGFASGVMIAASVWSLIIPSIEMATEHGVTPWIPAAVGFLCGICFLLLIDKLIPHLHAGADRPEGRKSALGRHAMLVLAVTIHNFPEGMAVGVVFAGALAEGSAITMAEALILSIGIAVQNFPEGAIISMPLCSGGMSKKRAFLYGVLSGIVEPIGAIITIFLTSVMSPLLPYILAFAAGAMIYVTVEELIPESQSGTDDAGTLGVAIGFIIMMILDVAMK